MNFKMTKVGLSLTPERVTRMEKQPNVVLPENYKAFLFQFNGGRPDPNCYPIRGLHNNPFGGIQHFLFLDHQIGSCNLDWAYRTYRGRVLPNLFPIAYEDRGNVICLSLWERDQNTGYYWDHEAEYIPPTYDNVYLIAPSFLEFLECILYRDISAEIAELLKDTTVIKRPH